MISDSDTLKATEIPNEKLLALLDASEKMMEAVSHHDRKSVLDTVVEVGRSLLKAESCAIFSAAQDEEHSQPNMLVLETYHTDEKSVSPSDKIFPIISAKGGGISAHVAKEGKLLRLNAEEIKNNPYIRNLEPDYLPSGSCYSSIIVPLKDRKNILLGILKVDNKKGLNNNPPGPEIEFTEADEKIIGILSDKVVVLLENLRVRKVIDSFMKDMQDARTRDSVPNLIIDWARDLLRADRSELALWNRGKEELIFEAISGGKRAKDKWIRKPVPDNGFIMKIWQDDLQTWGITDNVEDEPNFVALDKRTKSEIALRIEVDGTRIGMLNIESFNPAWFDEQDLRTLEILAQHAALSIQLTRVETHFHDLAHEVMENRHGSSEDILKKILFGIRESYGFEGGIFYLYQEKENNLRCLAYMGPEGIEIEPQKFVHNFKHPSLAGHVFKTKKPYYSEEPRKDPIVNQKGVDAFKIESPILGIPLEFRDEVKGVLTIWSLKNPPPRPEHVSSLEPFVRLAASKIALEDSKALYHSLVDNLPQCVFRKNLNGQFTSANESFRKSLKEPLKKIRPWSEIEGKRDEDFYREDLVPKFVEDDQEVRDNKKIVEKEEEHQTRWMDKPIWVKVVKTPVLNSRGEVTGVQAIFWDITEQRQLRKRYISLVEQSPDSIIVHQDKMITLANPAAVDLFGVASEKELKGRSILELFHPDDCDRAKERIEKLMRKEEVERMVEMKIRRADGETVDVEVYARSSPVDKEVQVVFHDLTRVRNLLGDMHHHVKKSLNQTGGFLTLQEYYTDLPPEVNRVFRSIRNRIKAMALVHDILYRAEVKTTVPMKAYLNELKEAVFDAHGVKEDRIHCAIRIEDIALDNKRATACGLIVNELLSNSITHAFRDDEKGEILVSLETTPDSNYKLSVSDNGSGIRKEHKHTDESLGLNLVRRLAYNSLKGKPKPSNDKGFTYEINFPKEIKTRAK